MQPNFTLTIQYRRVNKLIDPNKISISATFWHVESLNAINANASMKVYKQWSK